MSEATLEDGVRVVSCGNCRRPMEYVPLRLPLAPPSLMQDQDLAKAGLQRQMGEAMYGLFCLPCGRQLVGRLSPEYLTLGDTDRLHNRPRARSRGFWSRLAFWRGCRCPLCGGRFRTDQRALAFCPSCAVLLDVRRR